jgi:hypothetical protein
MRNIMVWLEHRLLMVLAAETAPYLHEYSLVLVSIAEQYPCLSTVHLQTKAVHGSYEQRTTVWPRMEKTLYTNVQDT